MVMWGSRKEEELPEVLRGKTPEEIAAAYKKTSELEQQVTQLTTDKTTIETQLNTQKTEFDEMKARMVDLEANQKPPEKPPEEPSSIWTDPQKFVNEQIRPTQDVALMSGMMSAKLYAKQGLSARDNKIWTKFEKEIDGTMNGFQPQQRVLPQSWLLALTLVKGQHEQEIAAAERTSSDFFSEGPSRGEPPAPEVQDKLTPEEEQACETFKWDKARYLATKKKQTIKQSEKGAYATYSV